MIELISTAGNACMTVTPRWKWISVKDGLPPSGEEVLVSVLKLCDDMSWENVVEVSQYRNEEKEWLTHPWDPDVEDHEVGIMVPMSKHDQVTHWAELPKPAPDSEAIGKFIMENISLLIDQSPEFKKQMAKWIIKQLDMFLATGQFTHQASRYWGNIVRSDE